MTVPHTHTQGENLAHRSNNRATILHVCHMYTHPGIQDYLSTVGYDEKLLCGSIYTLCSRQDASLSHHPKLMLLFNATPAAGDTSTPKLASNRFRSLNLNPIWNIPDELKTYHDVNIIMYLHEVTDISNGFLSSLKRHAIQSWHEWDTCTRWQQPNI